MIKKTTLQEFVKRRVAKKLQEVKALHEGVSDGEGPVRGRMTWGQIPSPEELQKALDEEGGWSMTLKGTDEDAFAAAMEAAGMSYGKAESMMSSGEGMHKVLTALTNFGNGDYPLPGSDEDPEMANLEFSELTRSAESLASGILDVLGFEWI